MGDILRKYFPDIKTFDDVDFSQLTEEENKNFQMDMKAFKEINEVLYITTKSLISALALESSKYLKLPDAP